jgi:gas vesicle protein
MDDSHSADRARGGRIAMAALIGATVGAGMALLFAPRSAAALPGKINGSAKSLEDASSRRYEAVAERISQVLGRANESAGRAVSAVEHGAGHYARASHRPRSVSARIPK